VYFEKKISEDVFQKLILVMTLRDAIISKISYYYNISYAKVIELKFGEIEELNLNEEIKNEILEYVNNPRDRNVRVEISDEALIFINCKGEKVERTHLIQAFNRAAKRLKLKDVRPSSLLEFKPMTTIPPQQLLKKWLEDFPLQP